MENHGCGHQSSPKRKKIRKKTRASRPISYGFGIYRGLKIKVFQHIRNS